MPDDINLFSLQGDFGMGNWLHGKAIASGNVQAVASLHRGVDLSASIDLRAYLGVEMGDVVKANLDAGARAGLALALEAAFPLDLFRAAGIVARLEARAEAAAYARARIGLDLERFAELLGVKLQGRWQDLLAIVLDELEISAGAWASIAVSAMFRGSAALVGSLIPAADGTPAGFTFSYDYRCGLGYGVGQGFILNLGFKDSARLLDRLAGAVTAAVEEEMEGVIAKLPTEPAAAARRAMPFLKLVLPLASRAAFQAAASLAQAVGDKKAAAAGTIALGFVREVQEMLLRTLIDFALDECRRVLDGILKAGLPGLSDAERSALIDALGRLAEDVADLVDADEPGANPWFALTIDLADPLMAVLDTRLLGDIDKDGWRENVGLFWSAAVLVRQVLSWTTGAADEPANAGAANPFDTTPAGAQGIVSRYVATKLGVPPGQALNLSDLVKFILASDKVRQLHKALPPEVDRVLEWLGGVVGTPDRQQLLGLFLKDAARLVQDPSRWVDVLTTAIGQVVETEVVPNLLARFDAMADPAMVEIGQRIVRPGVLALTKVILPGIAHLGEPVKFGEPGRDELLREQASAVLLQSLTRFLITAIDVVSERALADGEQWLRATAVQVSGGQEQGLAADIINACTAVFPERKLVEADVAALLVMAADLAKELKDKDRAKWIRYMEALVNLGLSTDPQMSQIYALEKQPNSPSDQDTLNQLLMEILGDAGGMAGLVLPKELELLGAGLRRAGEDLIKALDAGVQGLLKQVLDAIKSLSDLEKEIATLAKEVADLAAKAAQAVAQLAQQVATFVDNILDAIFHFGLKQVQEAAAAAPTWAAEAAPGAYRANFDAQRNVLKGPLTLIDQIAPQVRDEALRQAAAGTLSKEGVVGAVKRGILSAGAPDLAITIRVRRPARSALAARIGTGDDGPDDRVLGPFITPGSKILGAIADGVLDDPDVRRHVGAVVDLAATQATKQARLAALQEVMRANLSQKQAYDAVGQLVTDQPLKTRIDQPAANALYTNSAHLHVIVTGANKTYAGAVFGVPPRIKLLFNGKEYNYAAGEWAETAGGLTFDAELVPSTAGLFPAPVRPTFHVVGSGEGARAAAAPSPAPAGAREGARVEFAPSEAPAGGLTPEEAATGFRWTAIAAPHFAPPDRDLAMVPRSGVAAAVASQPAPAPGRVIPLRPGLNTVQVVVVDGKGQNHQDARFFHLRGTNPFRGQLVASVDVSPVPLGRPVTLTVRVVENLTNQPVAARVVVDGADIGAANAPLTHTFAGRRTRKFDPDLKKWVITVEDPAGSAVPEAGSGYSPAPIPFEFGS
jgi:hypothetical protein